MKQSGRAFQKMLKKYKGRRILSSFLCISMLFSVFAGINFMYPRQAEAEEENVTLQNPRIVKDSSLQAGQKVTWDCVWFGSYPQAEVIPANKQYTALDKELLQEDDLIKDDVLYQALQSATGWDAQGDIVINGEKYRRVGKEDTTYYTAMDKANYYQWDDQADYHYFKYQPIKWRVLSVDGSKAFLLADKVLDGKQYHTKYEDDVAWEESTIRSWLNGYRAEANKIEEDYSKGNFIHTAFTQSECDAIVKSKIENQKDTIDKIFLLSQSEVYTDAANKYGFVSKFNARDEASRAKSSLYAKAQGIWSASYYTGNCEWWLRSLGPDHTYGPLRSEYALTVQDDGSASRRSTMLNDDDNGVRPALNLNLATSADTGIPNLWSYAGKVCSDDAIIKDEGQNQNVSISNPRIVEDSKMEAGQKVTWDCLWFGSYPQAEVVPASEEYTALSKKLLQEEEDLVKDDILYQTLQSATAWDARGDIVINGEKYRRIKMENATDAALTDSSSSYNGNYHWKNATDYHYFKYQPIKWRVLSINGSEAFLLADKTLDDRQYHTVYEDVTWEESTLRSWLNGYGVSENKQRKDYSKDSFIQAAFNQSECAAITEGKTESQDNSDGIESGKDVVDKIFLLSQSEVCADFAKKYGFVTKYDYRLSDEALWAKSSLYAKAQGVESSVSYDRAGSCAWWLCFPGYANHNAPTADVTSSFSVSDENVNCVICGVRPALSLNLAASSGVGTSNLWSYAGTVKSETVEQAASISNPRIIKDNSMEAGQKVTWDCLWFGSYPQSEVISARASLPLAPGILREGDQGDFIKDDALYQALQSDTGWDAQGDIVINGEKYRRIKKEDVTSSSTYKWYNDTDYHYFKYEKIKWRVLSVNGAKVFLIADKALDDKPYHTSCNDVTWEESMIRSWLNGYSVSVNKQGKNDSKDSFISTAFGQFEYSAIEDSKVENKDNLSYGTKGGKDTVDKIFLLSESEVYTDAALGYGFVSDGNVHDEARRAKSSVYAKAQGTWVKGWSVDFSDCIGNCDWMLRSPGESSTQVTSMYYDGGILDSFGVYSSDHNVIGVRPALNLNLATASNAKTPVPWLYAGTVCSDGTIYEVSEDLQFPSENTQNKAVGVNVAYHTQQEIRDYVKKNKATVKDALEFAETPVTDKPYSLGKLSATTLQSAAAMLNQVRYIAGISDGVQLSDSYNELAQAAALACYANNELSHSPAQPDGMPDDMYALAKKGASSNLSCASWANCSLNETIISSWMEDGDDSNIDRVGHRRWILNPAMDKTGFGAVSGKNGTYSAVYTHDNNNSTAQEYGVMWPAQNMPVEYFGKKYPWSVSMGCTVDESKVQVTLTRKKDGKKWSFSKASADGDFYVNNVRYGQGGCIIFRPNQGIDRYEAGDEFKVEITGLGQGDVSYTVNFFALAGKTAPTASPKPTQKPVPSRWPVVALTPSPVVTPYPTATAAPSVMPSASTTVTPKPSAVIPTPGVTPAPEGTPDDMPTWEPDATAEPSITPEPVDSPEIEDTAPAKKLKKGSKATDKKTKAVYKVTATGNKKAVEYVKSSGKGKSNVSIPAAVKLQGKTFKVTSIAKNAFKKDKKLKKVSIGKNVKKIGNGAFNGCKNLKNVTAGKNVANIGANAFRGCNGLVMVTIPSKVKKIGTNAFRQCKNLRYIMVKTKKLTLRNVGKGAFSGGYRSPRIKTDKNIWKPYSRIFLKRGISGKAVFIIDPVKLY